MNLWHIDTHVHLYDRFDTARALGLAATRLDGARRALCLADRAGQDTFEQLRGSRVKLPEGWRSNPGPTPSTWVLTDAEGRTLHLLAGRQIVTRERLELLALGATSGLADGRPGIETVDRIEQLGALPVAAWALGKWMGPRGRVVRAWMERFGPRRMALADSAMRPIGWPEPALLRLGRRDGFAVLAGSDPFPMRQDENLPGSYFTVLASVHDNLSGVLLGILDGASRIERHAGRRRTLWGALKTRF